MSNEREKLWKELKKGAGEFVPSLGDLGDCLIPKPPKHKCSCKRQWTKSGRSKKR